jgi:hypothetical protein
VAFEIDHIFILTAPGAPEAELLAGIGLVEGSRNVHPSQGTANRRFFFPNAMVELLWVANEAEAAAGPLGLGARWANRATASPFGILLRAKGLAPADPPFDSWEYRPAAMPDLVANIALGVSRDEPFWGYLPRARRQGESSREPLDHPAGMRELTGVRVASPPLDPASLTVNLLPWIEAPAHRLDLTFDQGAQDRAADLRPHLPVTFKW